MTASLFGTVDDEYAAVAVGRPVRGEFTYLVPTALKAQLLPGLRVKIPFGRSTILGFYLGPAPAPSTFASSGVQGFDLAIAVWRGGHALHGVVMEVGTGVTAAVSALTERAHPGGLFRTA